MPTATKTKPPLDGWSVSQRHGFDTKLKGLVLGFCLGFFFVGTTGSVCTRSAMGS